MKKFILITLMLLLSMHCAMSPNSTGFATGSGGNRTTIINPTRGQELLDLKQALDSGAITEEEYDEFKLKIIGKVDAPVDSTDTN